MLSTRSILLEAAMKATILLIDDDPVDLKVLKALVESLDFDTLAVRSGEEGIKMLKSGGIDLVLSDVRMPGMSGVDVVSEMARRFSRIPIILITADADVRTAVDAMKQGAFDYVTKPADETELVLTMERALEHCMLKKENAFLRSELAVGGIYGDRLIGVSPPMLEVFDLISRVAVADSTVLISGETGTGKELVAQMIHFKSNRAEKPFVAVNCAAINQGLSESELFGHEKGAFTGAAAARKGRFEDADGGTLFLDEITEGTPEFQAKLLRVLQEGTIQRVGGNQDIKVDVRVIASTNLDIDNEVKEGRFREDLFFRLNVVPVVVPPLRDRKEDIPILAKHFLATYGSRYNSSVNSISDQALDYLVRQEWSGNVRELQHAVERAVVLASHEILESDDFAPRRNKAADTGGERKLADVVDRQTRLHVLEVLESESWHKQKVADILGVDRATLYRLIKKFGLDG
jgi:DNA-binding NtrC family response regulator